MGKVTIDKLTENHIYGSIAESFQDSTGVEITLTNSWEELMVALLYEFNQMTKGRLVAELPKVKGVPKGYYLTPDDIEVYKTEKKVSIPKIGYFLIYTNEIHKFIKAMCIRLKFNTKKSYINIKLHSPVEQDTENRVKRQKAKEKITKPLKMVRLTEVNKEGISGLLVVSAVQINSNVQKCKGYKGLIETTIQYLMKLNTIILDDIKVLSETKKISIVDGGIKYSGKVDKDSTLEYLRKILKIAMVSEDKVIIYFKEIELKEEI